MGEDAGRGALFREPAGNSARLGDDVAMSAPLGGGYTNEVWFARARRVIPGGVDSPVRSFSSVGGTPITIARGEGPYAYDIEGRRYIDLIQSYGAVILGHADPGVTEAIETAAAAGTTFGTPTPGETLLGEEVVARAPACEMVRFVSSGTEAAMSAVRLARAFTGRDRVIKFEGCYHGHSDGLLARAGSGAARSAPASANSSAGFALWTVDPPEQARPGASPRQVELTTSPEPEPAVPGSPGIPAGHITTTIVVPYNTVPGPEILDETVACVIVEPVAANMGLVPPGEGFLEGLRAACDAAGALLIFDEVITGFRLAYGGASELAGVRADLYCFGKVIGGGLPLAAFGGRQEVMSRLAPEGPVYQAGTLSGNPLATAAGRAVLDQLDRDAYRALSERVRGFCDELGAILDKAGVRASVARSETLCSVFFAAADTILPVRDFEGALGSAVTGIYARFFHLMLEQGIMLAPGPYEAIFVGMSHTEAVLEEVLSAAAWAAERLG